VKLGGYPDPEPGPRAENGYIGLQNHDDKVAVHFREVAVRPVRRPAAGDLVNKRFN
jgi:hypothetical protein